MSDHNERALLFWIGDNALEVYLNSNKSLLKHFNNEIILYDRKLSDPENKLTEEPVTFLKEFYPKINQQYKLKELDLPMFELLNNRIGTINSNAILFVGDTSELLFQSFLIISFGSNPIPKIEKKKTEKIPFAAMLLLDDESESNYLNLQEYDALFLRENMPFKEELETAISFRNLGMKYFANSYRFTQKKNEINEFLWHYSEKNSGLEKIIDNITVKFDGE